MTPGRQDVGREVADIAEEIFPYDGIYIPNHSYSGIGADIREAIAAALTSARQAGREEMREEAGSVIAPWLSTSELRLRVGELTAGEVRAVKAVVQAISAGIAALPIDDGPAGEER